MKPAIFFALVGQLGLVMATVNSSSSVDTTTACVTTTIFTTTTVTVTGHPGESVASSSSAVESKSVPKVSEPQPTFDPSTIATTFTGLPIVVPFTSESAPYPTTNYTTKSATGSVTAPHSSGTGVTTVSSSAIPPQFTSGQGQIATNSLAMALVVLGSAALLF